MGKICDFIIVSYFSLFFKLGNKGLEAGILVLVFPLVQNIICIFCCLDYLFNFGMGSFTAAIIVVFIGAISGLWLLHKLRVQYLKKFEYLCLIYNKAPKFVWIMFPIIHLAFSFVFLLYSMILTV
mgnify:FL=1